MKVFHSVCSNLFFPESRKSIRAFEEMADFLAERGVEGLEFYHDGDGPDRVGRALARWGLDGVYIAVIPLKEGLKHLCATDADNRAQALEIVRRSIDLAEGNGMSSVMVNSGRIEPGREAEQLDAMFASFEELYNYIERRNAKVTLELEPCDSAMDARQLLGPAARTRAFLDRLHAAGLPLMLTMDSAHTSEEGEDFPEAVRRVKPYCRHVHYANCRIDDPRDELYGDKHLGYEYDRSVWTFAALEQLTAQLDALYAGDEPLRIGLEALCREADPYAWFEQTWSRMPWLRGEGRSAN